MLERRWFILPVLSGALLVLAFYPYDVWPLTFVALAPLFYFVAAFPNRPAWQVFLGGCIAGGMLALSLSLGAVVEFRWSADQQFFITAVRLSFFLVAALGGVCTGIALLIYRALRSDSLLHNSLLGAVLYVTGELLLYSLYGGYNFALLGYAAAEVPVLMAFGAVGGLFLVSFLIAWGNALLAEAPQHWARRPAVALGVVPLYVIGVLCVGAVLYARAPEAGGQSISVASIQFGDDANPQRLIGREYDGVFSLSALEPWLREASKNKSNLVVYPFSPSRGVLYDDKKPVLKYDLSVASADSVAAWFAQQLPAGTTALVWASYYQNDLLYNELQTYKDGALAAEYRKRSLFPFFDYTPRWAQHAGLSTISEEITPGGAGQQFTIAGREVAGAICSEVYGQDEVRTDAQRSSVIVSVGSESFFGTTVRVYSLRAARFRAVENNLPVIRANVLGPSAIIRADGSLMAYAGIGESTLLRGEIVLADTSPTFFSRFGNAPLLGFFAVIFAAGLLRRWYNAAL